MLVSTAACDGDPPPDEVTEYVAIGDSYTAAPVVPITDLENPCLRSNHNYPNLIEDELPHTG